MTMHCTGVSWEAAYAMRFQARGNHIGHDVYKQVGEEPKCVRDIVHVGGGGPPISRYPPTKTEITLP